MDSDSLPNQLQQPYNVKHHLKSSQKPSPYTPASTTQNHLRHPSSELQVSSFLQDRSGKKPVREYSQQLNLDPQHQQRGQSGLMIEVLEQQSPHLKLPGRAASQFGHSGDHEEQASVKTHSKMNSKDYQSAMNNNGPVSGDREVSNEQASNKKMNNIAPKIRISNEEGIDQQAYREALPASMMANGVALTERQLLRKKEKSKLKRQRELQEELDKILQQEFINVISTSAPSNKVKKGDKLEQTEVIDFNRLAQVTESDMESIISRQHSVNQSYNHSYNKQYESQNYRQDNNNHSRQHNNNNSVNHGNIMMGVDHSPTTSYIAKLNQMINEEEEKKKEEEYLREVIQIQKQLEEEERLHQQNLMNRSKQKPAIMAYLVPQQQVPSLNLSGTGSSRRQNEAKLSNHSTNNEIPQNEIQYLDPVVVRPPGEDGGDTSAFRRLEEIKLSPRDENQGSHNTSKDNKVVEPTYDAKEQTQNVSTSAKLNGQAPSITVNKDKKKGIGNACQACCQIF